MPGPAILIDSLTLSYGRTPVLRDVGFEVPRGRTLGLIGPNGAGKTTLVGCLLGLLRPNSGTISIDGLAPGHPEARRGLGHVPERPSFDAGRSARANLSLHHALAGLASADREADVSSGLQAVGLRDEADRRVKRFSKGMLQRLSFAAALLGEPRWLVLDEPFAGVDPAGVALLRGLLTRARERGATILLNSHRLDQVGRLCDKVALLTRGNLERVMETTPGGGDDELERLVIGAASDGAPS